MKKQPAEIIREYGPFEGIDAVHGVTFDGSQVWFASGDKLNALDPASGKTVRAIDVAAFKELAGVSRKHAIPLLEYLDEEKVTLRRGNERVILGTG